VLHKQTCPPFSVPQATTEAAHTSVADALLVTRAQRIQHAVDRRRRLVLCELAAALVEQRLQRAADDELLHEVHGRVVHVDRHRVGDRPAPAHAVRHRGLVVDSGRAVLLVPPPREDLDRVLLARFAVRAGADDSVGPLAEHLADPVDRREALWAVERLLLVLLLQLQGEQGVEDGAF